MVTALVVDFDTEPDILAACLGSLERHGGPRLEGTVVLDNGSTRHRREVAEIVAGTPRVREVRESRNLGFTGGVNRGLAHCRTPYVLLLNSDATLTPGALPALVAKLDAAAGDVVAVTPKLVFASDGVTIDAAGSALRPDGLAFNVGIGQLDIGQFGDEECFGACFAAVLARREAFGTDQVGPLDERLFMYLEDVDWCWRARLLGRRILLVPDATVLHIHSASTRRLPTSFKRYLIERNLLLVAAKNAEGVGAVKIWASRLAVHARVGARRHELVLLSGAVAGAVRRLPGTLAARPALQRRRRLRDGSITSTATDEEVFFDPATHAPIRSWGMLAAAHRRRARVFGDGEAAALALLFDGIAHGRLPPDRAKQIAPRLAPPARELVDDLTSEPRVTVIMVDRGGGSPTAEALRSALDRTPGAGSWQVLVVQNGPEPPSQGGTSAMPGAEVVVADVTAGHGAAVNTAVKAAQGRYLWLLDPEISLPDDHGIGALPAWLDEHPACAIASPRLLDAGGQAHPGQVRRWATLPPPVTAMLERPARTGSERWPVLWRLWSLVNLDHLPVRSRDVPAVNGAAAFLRRAAFEQVGGFDPASSPHREESDLQRRLRDAGWTIRWVASSTVVHRGRPPHLL